MRRALVIGSGPAGVACAAGLADAGWRPLVLDGGRRLERAVAERVSAGDGALAGELRRTFPVDVDRLPLKPAFGSLYPYAREGLRADGVEAVPSLAVGGLSAVWGAAMLPYGAREHAGWPFGPGELEAHYRAVLRLVPLAGEEDALAAEYPLHVDRPGRLAPTAQTAALLDDLRASSLLAGRARLAVHTEGPLACRYVAACMLGCPYGSIWTAAQTLDDLVASGRVEHRPGAVAERFEERADGVGLDVRDAETGAREQLVGERLFVAAGALGTARLFLASTGRGGVPLRLRDSAYFTVPLVRRRRPRGAPEEGGNVLAQAFVELDDPALSRHRIHLQLYGYNDLMLRAVAGRLRLREPVAARLLRPLLGRLLYLQGYLHSDDSPTLTATLEGDILALEAESVSSERPRAALRALRALPLRPLERMLQVWPVGKGFHVGASLPMRERPGELESDLLGRPGGFRRVHVVDASVLPSVPAQTITLPVMANAHRIASLASED